MLELAPTSTREEVPVVPIAVVSRPAKSITVLLLERLTIEVANNEDFSLGIFYSKTQAVILSFAAFCLLHFLTYGFTLQSTKGPEGLVFHGTVLLVEASFEVFHFGFQLGLRSTNSTRCL